MGKPVDVMPEDLRPCQLSEVMDCLTQRYGRSGSGRASTLRLVGAYVIFQTEGAAGFRKRGFSRDSILLYREKLREAGVHIQSGEQKCPKNK